MKENLWGWQKGKMRRKEKVQRENNKYISDVIKKYENKSDEDMRN